MNGGMIMANSLLPELERRWWIKNYDHDVRPTLTFPRFPAYEIPFHIKNTVMSSLPDEFRKVITSFYARCGWKI
jgi:hypothetical protein